MKAFLRASQLATFGLHAPLELADAASSSQGTWKLFATRGNLDVDVADGVDEIGRCWEQGQETDGRNFWKATCGGSDTGYGTAALSFEVNVPIGTAKVEVVGTAYFLLCFCGVVIVSIDIMGPHAMEEGQ